MFKQKLVDLLSAKDIVKAINESLETTWTDTEWKVGKKIEVQEEWCGRMNFVVSEYRKAGWTVKKEVMISASKPSRFVYLVFWNPLSFKNCPKELKDTGVRI